jgi:predicted lipoprotein with Yx(FWY)xxD motif
MKPRWIATRAVALLFIVGTLTLSCSKDSEDATPAAPDPAINLTSTSLGNVMTDETGRTLYFFSNDYDSTGASSCTGGCLTTWPVFYRATPKLGTGLAAADFGTITRADGAKQTTYKSWPLYYYKDDVASGDVKGENVGNIWFVAKPTYSIMVANAQLVGNNGKTYTSDYKEGAGKTIYFTDGQGRTLYGFKNDKNNKNNYTKADLSNNALWPLYEETLKELPSTIDKTLFGSITVGGHQQLTFKGWPLYYFQFDNGKRGLNKGISYPQPGVWPVVNKDTPVAPAP